MLMHMSLGLTQTFGVFVLKATINIPSQIFKVRQGFDDSG